MELCAYHRPKDGSNFRKEGLHCGTNQAQSKSMLRITLIAETDETATLKLEGRIAGEWVSEVQRECEMWLTQGRKTVLDLSGVVFVDEQGIEKLKALKRNGVNVIGSSLFLSRLLEKDPEC